MSKQNEKQTLLYRITHRNNIPWLLRNGLVCQSHPNKDPAFIPIGNSDLIDHRCLRIVDKAPGGMLADYVPFYFCKHSLMLYKIHTGQVVGVNVTQDDIVYVVSSIERLQELATPFVFTDRHAYVATAQFFTDPEDLNQLDWELISSRDFKRDPNDPGKIERRAAECLVHQQLPVTGLLGLACRTNDCLSFLQDAMKRVNIQLTTVVKPDWYF